jgi:hypothetical protein
MEAILQEVIVGLVTQAITKAAGSVGRSAGLIHTAKAPEWLTGSISPSVTSAVTAMMAEFSDSGLSESTITKAAVALRSPQAQQLQRMLVVSTITQRQARTSNLTAELTAILTLIGGCSSDDAVRISSSVAPVLLTTAVRSVEAFQQNSGRYFSVLKQLALQEESAGYIETLVSYSTKTYEPQTPAELAEVYQFAQAYLQEMAARNADLVPQHFDMQMRVTLNDLYVAPRFLAINDDVTRLAPMNEKFDLYAQEVTFPLSHALRRMYRSVVLGSPGAGKTTLTQKIIHDLCSEVGTANACIPFLITLRKYDQFRPDVRASFVEYLSEYITGQLHLPVSQKSIIYLLAAGKAMVIFDGLDELLHLEHRKDIVNAIESFGRRYPGISILVTSRIVGYEQAPLDRRTFSQMRLANFDNESVEAYVNNWFGINPRLDPLEKLTAARNFLIESASVSDLRSNPLLLSLMCNIFRGAGYIPQNRADLYERCATMLFEEWDHSRGIQTGGPLRTDARNALQDVAYWTLTSPELSSGIPERQLRRRLTKFLAANRYGSEDPAADAADELLRLWRGRAWILTDMGSDVLRPIYQFTHRTFQEYFAATHLARISNSPSQLWRKLRAKAITGQWDVVAQIAIQTFNAARVGSVDKICDSIIDDVEIGKRGSVEALLFICTYLDALAPGPSVIKRLVRVAVDLMRRTLPNFAEQPTWISYERARDLLLRRDGQYDPPGPLNENIAFEVHSSGEEGDQVILDVSLRRMNEPLAAMFSSSSVIHDVVSAVFDEYCTILIADNDLETASCGLLLTLAKTQFIDSARYSASSTQGEEVLRPRAKISKQHSSSSEPSSALQSLPRLAGENFWLPIIAARYHNSALVDLFASAGMAGLFNAESPFDVVIAGARPCFAIEIIARYVAGEPTVDDLALIAKVGDYVRSNYTSASTRPLIDPDWYQGSDLGGIVIVKYFLNVPGGRPDGGYYDSYWNGGPDNAYDAFPRESDPCIALGVIIMMCICAEIEQWDLEDLSSDKVASLALGPVTHAEGLFLRRFGGLYLPNEHLTKRIALPTKDMDLLLRWSRDELSFVR